MKLSLDRVSRTTGRNRILDGISLDVGEGDFCVVIGPTGCGKTTLLKVIDLLLRPSSGKLLLDGVDHAGCSEAACTRARRRMSMVMQRPFMLSGSVRRNVESGLRLRGLHPAPGQVESGLAAAGLGGLIERNARTLSGGEMQKAALARAIVTEPEILLLDEPLSSVDQGFKPEMRALIRGLHRDRGMTVIMATHDFTDALALASHVAVLSEGRLVQHARVDDVLLKPSSLFVASFSGLRNILHAVFDDMRARVGDLEIILPEPARGSGYIVVPPESVTISPACPDSSQRNCFQGIVESVEPGMHVNIVVMAVGSTMISAAITRESTERLGLRPGIPAWVSFKASSVRILS